MLAPYQANVKDAGGIDTSQWMSPLKIFEYMAYSKAIICSDLNALREILTDRVNALLVPPNCLEAWEQAVKELEGDIKLRKDLGKRAKDNFLRNYTWDRRAAKVLSNFLTTSTCNSKSQGIK
jgi:glycosyltransferase involved in cell wall biosynthesis